MQPRRSCVRRLTGTCAACAQPHVLQRALAYTAAAAAAHQRGRREKGSAAVVQLAAGPGTSAGYKPGPLGVAGPLEAVSVFVALCKRLPDGQVRCKHQTAHGGFLIYVPCFDYVRQCS